jgi:hypothetical protein
LSDLTGDSITGALWRYFVDAGGFPRRLQCDFDRRFLHGSVGQLLRAHGVRIGASPPHRQSQNGAVERNWNTAVEMGRAYLAKAGLPKRYWFWAVREATIRMNMLPVKARICTDDEGAFNDLPPTANRTGTPPFLEFGILAQVDKTPPPNPAPPTQTKEKKSSRKSLSDRAAQLATPLELFYGVRPDYRVLYKFGTVRFFRRTIESTGQKKSKFSSQSHTGIALGRSDCTNGMMFWDPTTSRFSVSADYSLDPDRSLANPFPELNYGGGFTRSLLSGTTPSKEPHPPGSTVFALIQGDVFEGKVLSVSTPPVAWYTIQPTGSNDPVNVSPLNLSSPDDPMLPCDQHLTESWEVAQLPNWITNDARLAMNVDGYRRRGNLLLDSAYQWSFVQRNDTGKAMLTINLADLPTTWCERLLDGSLELGWQEIPRAFHVSASGILRGVPPSFKQSMRESYTDYQIWLDLYIEEYCALGNHGTFDVITAKEYETKYSHILVIPTMNVQTIKKDELGLPVCAKSCMVVLGNLEDTIWTNSEVHAPVLRKESNRLLTTIAVNIWKPQKQGDCKNAFCHPVLPDDETVIVRPPPQAAPLVSQANTGNCARPSTVSVAALNTGTRPSVLLFLTSA